MNEDELRQLFGDVSAPGGVDEWCDRQAPTFRRPRPQWMAPVAGVVAVAVVAAGLGSYFGIRAAHGTPSVGGALAKVSPGSGPSPRMHPALAYDAANGTVVLYGGTSPNDAQLDDTWIYTAAGWRQADPAHSPGELIEPIAAYDPITHDVLLMSSEQGDSCGFVSWLWNGSDWAYAGPPINEKCAAPMETFSLQMATDPQSGRILMVASGGEAVHGCPAPISGAGATAIECPLQPAFVSASATYEWTGGTWINKGTGPASSAGLLVAARDHGYVPPRPTALWFFTIIHNMESDGGPACASTSTPCPPQPKPVALSGPSGTYWTGSQWLGWSSQGGGVVEQLQLPAPAAYDPATDSLLVWSAGRTWEWSEDGWTVASSTTSPPSNLSGGAMAYDSATQQVLLFGESSSSGVLSAETWAWEGTNWLPIAATTQPLPSAAVPSLLPAPASPPGIVEPQATASGITRLLCPYYSPGTHPGQDLFPACPIPAG